MTVEGTLVQQCEVRCVPIVRTDSIRSGGGGGEDSHGAKVTEENRAARQNATGMAEACPSLVQSRACQPARILEPLV
jgi:hypothetical protein